MLDLSSLRQAINSLKSAINVSCSAEMDKMSSEARDAVRAGVIQNFEFTYELCWKFMKRWLEANGEGSYVDGASRKEIFRIAAERQLIENVESWFEYSIARNETAHTYNRATAEEVFESAASFLTHAEELLKNLEKRND